MTQIKICGLQTPRDAAIINQSRPDFAGVVFAAGRHQVSPDQAKLIRQHVDAKIPLVGVFMNAPESMIKDLYDQHIIQIAQLHGDEDESMVRALQAHHIPVIKVFKPTDEKAKFTNAEMVMFDSGGGSGRTLDWQQIPSIDQPLALAGGLNPANVSKAIEIVQPTMVDVSSGVEVSGQKDLALITAMVTIAHRK
ncbi:phosphoribosylanthranilate isomerase [Nicoliella lavandulae]|uniref:N-(5'-phosphoribosyl)anthranilate isomerase n=1 Tax=Nicoliella lavandulae TaxID=3082954 RepID=A0ABU8SMY8_9LACO